VVTRDVRQDSSSSIVVVVVVVIVVVVESSPFSELAAAKMERKELDSAKMTSCVIRSYSETVIKPLPGYDQ
jgi:hypothetical protein